MIEDKRNIWDYPWKYSEGFIIAIGVAFTGIILQLILGKITPSSYSYPVNAIIGVLFIAVLILTYFLFRKSWLIRWISSVYSTIPAIIVFLSAVILLGIVPQFSDQSTDAMLPRGLALAFGWFRMTNSWMFILLCFYLLVILGFTILSRTKQRQTWRDVGFYLNHLGLLIALMCGLLGSADRQQLSMTVIEGGMEWKAVDNNQVSVELPLAIQLDTFMIEEYPPKLVIIDPHTGKMLPENKPESYQFEGVGKTAQLAGLTLEILEYLPQAAIMRDSNMIHVFPYIEEGAAPAIKVRVTSPGQTEPEEGWVSCGSYIFPYNVLYSGYQYGIAMPNQEIKKYRSEVTIYTETEETIKSGIEVNTPLTVGDWVIYQLSYDTSKGKYSKTSSFQLVRDPWLKAVYSGIFMLIAGSIYLFIAGPKKQTK